MAFGRPNIDSRRWMPEGHEMRSILIPSRDARGGKARRLRPKGLVAGVSRRRNPAARAGEPAYIDLLNWSVHSKLPHTWRHAASDITANGYCGIGCCAGNRTRFLMERSGGAHRRHRAAPQPSRLRKGLTRSLMTMVWGGAVLMW